MSHSRPRMLLLQRLAVTLAGAVMIGIPLGLEAAEAAPSDEVSLAAREAELLGQYRELERSFLRLADVLAGSDPRRADALRGAFERAREAQIGDRVSAIVAMLEQGQLLKAGTSQQDAIAQLQALLTLLESGVGERQSADAAKQVRAYLGRIAKLIARQREIEAATDAGAEADQLVERQRAAADETGGLAAEVSKFAEGLADTPGSESEPPSNGGGEQAGGGQGRGQDGERPAPERDSTGDEGSDEAARSRRTARRLEQAEARMRGARDRLREAEAKAARTEQEQAVEELESARAELEEILRQLREEEVTRLLVQLEARLRRMLESERHLLADTERHAAAAGQADRERQLEAARLAREQASLTAEAARGMAMLRDDGSAVAIPQALEQVHDDSAEASTRLGRGETGSETQSLLAEIVTGLEEMLAAVEKARQEQSEREAKGGGGRAAEPGEQPLVDKLSELKMLRTLQLRVNRRTSRLAGLLDEGDAAVNDPGVRGALVRLAERQRAIEAAARAIVNGLTE